MAIRAGIFVVIVAILLGSIYYTQHRHVPLKVSGFVEAYEIRVGSRVGGRVAKAPAVEGANVHTGDLLIELEPFDLVAKQGQAKAQLDASAASEELAKLTFDRINSSFQANATSAADRDRAQSELKNASAQKDLRQHELEQIVDQIGELKIAAPVDGVVEAVDLRPGDIVAPNAPVLSVFDTSQLWVRAYVPENHLDIKVGQKVRVSLDSFAGRKFGAHISFVARQGEFTPDNIQTPDDRSKQVFRIKVTLDEGLDVLRPGMAADVLLEE